MTRNDRNEQNQRKWARPENWYAGRLGVYVAPGDSGTWVPKRPPGVGWTPNFAHRRSWAWLGGLVASQFAVALLLARAARRGT